MKRCGGGGTVRNTTRCLPPESLTARPEKLSFKPNRKGLDNPTGSLRGKLAVKLQGCFFGYVLEMSEMKLL